MRLTENELQYVVAFLFIVLRETALQNIVVGDRVLDVATGTERDVVLSHSQQGTLG